MGPVHPGTQFATSPMPLCDTGTLGTRLDPRPARHHGTPSPMLTPRPEPFGAASPRGVVDDGAGRDRARCGWCPRRWARVGEDVADSYALDNTAAEQVRLNRQAAALRPITERLFRAAAIGPGMSVLDVGCGVGDVSLIAAELVLSGGRVVGFDRDPRQVSAATARFGGDPTVSFVQATIDDPPHGEFDAIVGSARADVSARPRRCRLVVDSPLAAWWRRGVCREQPSTGWVATHVLAADAARGAGSSMGTSGFRVDEPFRRAAAPVDLPTRGSFRNRRTTRPRSCSRDVNERRCQQESSEHATDPDRGGRRSDGRWH